MAKAKRVRCPNCKKMHDLETNNSSRICYTCTDLGVIKKKGRVQCLNCNRKFMSMDVKIQRICLYCKNQLFKFKEDGDIFSAYGFDSFVSFDSAKDCSLPDLNGVEFEKAN